MLSAVVGSVLVFQHTPRAVTAAPPSDIIVPPDSAVVSVIALMAIVDTVGAFTLAGSAELSSEHEYNNARDDTTNANSNRDLFMHSSFNSAPRSPRAPALENLALHHQINVPRRNSKRSRLTNRDHTLWIFLSHFWANCQESLVVIQPETVIRRDKRGFRLCWKWKSRPRWPGRRRIPRDDHSLFPSELLKTKFRYESSLAFALADSSSIRLISWR